MSTPTGDPYRPPCGGWEAFEKWWLGACANHYRPNEAAIREFENITTVTDGGSSRPLQTGDVPPFDDCLGNEEIDQNCFRITGDTLDFSSCTKYGWKAVYAQKMWHGRPGFEHCDGTACGQSTVRYLSWAASGTYTTGYTTIDGSGYCTVTESDPVSFSFTATIDRYSGIITVSGCNLDAISEGIVDDHYTAEAGGVCMDSYLTTWNPGDVEPDEYGCNEYRESFTLNDTEYTHTKFYPGGGTPPGSLIRFSITVTLAGEYTLQDVYDDAIELLSKWDLTDDVQFPWQTFAETTCPWVHRDETGQRNQMEVSSPYCDYVDSSGTTGEVIGDPMPNGYGPFFNWRKSPSLWTFEPIPDTATDWFVEADGLPPMGALLHITTAGVYVKKWAATTNWINGVETAPDPRTPSYNHFRPCGADRDDARFPNAWPICGRVAIDSATQNGGSVDIVLSEAADYLRTGDFVDFTGVSGLGSNLEVTVTDSTHFSVTGTLSGAYVSDGYVSSNGAPAYYWNDTYPKGDYVYLQWSVNPCGSPITADSGEITADGNTITADQEVSAASQEFTCSDECIPFVPCSPSVACISPNGEEFHNGITYDFPQDAPNIEQCWQAICRFTMDDPLWDTDANPFAPQVEARCSLPYIGVEQAPELPIGFTYGCPDDPTCGTAPTGGCAASEWV